MTAAFMIDVRDIHPFTDFLRHAKSHTKRLKKSGRPSLLTINGQAEIVVQDAKSYQLLLEQLAQLDDYKAVQNGLADMQAGRGQTIAAAFDALDKKYFSASKTKK